MLNKGALIEYKEGDIPLLLGFEFNPESITFTRNMSGPSKKTQAKKKNPEKSGGLGMVSDDITFSLRFLLDATDRMNDGAGFAATLGVQPEIDVIERMATLQSSKAEGVLKLFSVSKKSGLLEHKKLPIILFVWGFRIIPCQIVRCSVNNKAFLSGLVPFRAEVDLSLKVVEEHPLYTVEHVRQLAMVVMYYIDQGTQILSSI